MNRICCLLAAPTVSVSAPERLHPSAPAPARRCVVIAQHESVAILGVIKLAFRQTTANYDILGFLLLESDPVLPERVLEGEEDGDPKS